MSLTTEQLAHLINDVDKIRNEAAENQEFGFTDSWSVFIQKMRLLHPQAWDFRIPNYIFNCSGWKRVSSKEDCGDVQNAIGEHFEVKTTMLTPGRSNINIVQIRLWQRVTGYHIFVIDASQNYSQKYEVYSPLYHFFLSRNEMKEEIEKIGNSAHGTKEANKHHETREWAIRFKWDNKSTVYRRWYNRYLQSNTEKIMGHKAKAFSQLLVQTY